MDESDSARTLDLADKHKMILAFVGVHPEKASGGADNLLRIIDENVERIAGIGEIGLDPTLAADEAEYTQQKCVFDEFLNAAEKYRMPVSIHSRKSIDDVLDALSTHSVRSACLHWYDGNKKQLRRAVDAGLYLGFGPVMVYANDKKSLLARLLMLTHVLIFFFFKSSLLTARVMRPLILFFRVFERTMDMASRAALFSSKFIPKSDL